MDFLFIVRNKVRDPRLEFIFKLKNFNEGFFA